MTQSLEAQLTALCEQHGLERLGVNAVRDGQIMAVAWGSGQFASARADTANQAVQKAISDLNARRVAVDLAAMGDAS